MLELRPTCEHCNKPLPPESNQAMICSFECTFCSTCVEQILLNVCPNCGGGFTPRPVRPKHNWNDDNYLAKYSASRTIKHHPVDITKHKVFAEPIKDIPPDER